MNWFKKKVKYEIIGETETYYVAVGTLPSEDLVSYMAVNKEHGVVEYSNFGLYFVNQWVGDMEKALMEQRQGLQGTLFPSPDGRL